MELKRTYIAKKFLSVHELVEELGYTIPIGTKLYDSTGQEKGTYKEHINTSHAYLHTMQTAHGSYPLAPTHIGIFIEIGFDRRIIENQLLANDKTRMV